MSNLNVFFSNRLEILAEELSRRIREPLSSPLVPEIIVIQSRGMERWVSMELAKHHGIWANGRFPFPNIFLQDIVGRILHDLPDPSPWSPDIMVFCIMKLLPGCLKQPEFETVKAYLEDDTNRLKLYQLSENLADLFDQYLVFRPEMVFAWEKKESADGTEQSWQAQLWRKLVDLNGPMHRARLRQIVFDRLAEGSVDPACLPQRVSVFGISYLPPFHLEIFSALSNFINLNFFILNPCKEYWTDIVSGRQHQKIRKKMPYTADISAHLHVEEGNRLLASMGNLGKDFFRLLDNLNAEFHELFVDLTCDDMLSCIQSDILNLKKRSAATPDHQINTGTLFELPPEEPVQINTRDTSIQVHSCHSPMREIEVLHDNLLAMFEQDTELQPNDVIVMTPDIETYAPYIQAVFATQTNDIRRIPFSIADQSARKESRLIEGFLRLMELKDGRLTSTQITGLLDIPSIRQKFGLTDEDVSTIERWVRDTQIRWGRDAGDRVKFDLPRFGENTWQSGLNRLLLGYAMPGYHRDLFEEILPFDEIEGNDINMLGNMAEFLERIFRCVTIIEHPKTLQHWKDALHFILDHLFLSDDETERDIQSLRQLFDNLADRQEESGLAQKLEAEVIRAYLCNRLDDASFGSGFMSRGVTFCAMLPMRSIPFNLICLIGLDSGAFPREIRPLSFDLMARHPRIGDRSRRNDDKYIFLESILCARKRLYISYVGQSIQDNSRIPPSVLVSELLDELAISFFLPDGDIHDHVITCHRLQPFSPIYFHGDQKFFSYSEENMLASAKHQTLKTPSSLISAKLDLSPEEVAEWKIIDIDTLGYFFSNPARFIMEKRLGIYLDQHALMTVERENFDLSPLERYTVEQNLVNSRFSGMDLDDFRPVQRALGQLPTGRVGDRLYNELSLDVDAFFDDLDQYTRGEIEAPLEIDVKIFGFRLIGRLTNIYEAGYVYTRYANRRATDLLKLWLNHLIYQLFRPDCRPAESYIVCKDRIDKFNQSANPERTLKNLLELFRQGLEQPIHFFPETSLNYIQQIEKKPDNPNRARDSARRTWLGNDYKRGEIEDPYYYQCFKNIDPIDESFEQIAKRIYSPLLAHHFSIAVRKK
jgi:exodeoxyribonuclease V gamma subunit